MKKIKEVTIEVIDKPSNSFCVGCKQTDVRLMKDTLNLVFMTLSQLTEYLGIEGNVKKKCKGVLEWVRANRKRTEGLKKTAKKGKKNGNV